MADWILELVRDFCGVALVMAMLGNTVPFDDDGKRITAIRTCYRWWTLEYEAI